MRLASVDETEMTGRLPVLQQQRVLHLIPPTPTPCSGASVPGLTGPVDLEGELEVPCSISLRNDESVCLSQLLFPFKTQAPPKKEIDIIHPNLFFPP